MAQAPSNITANDSYYNNSSRELVVRSQPLQRRDQENNNNSPIVPHSPSRQAPQGSLVDRLAALPPSYQTPEHLKRVPGTTCKLLKAVQAMYKTILNDYSPFFSLSTDSSRTSVQGLFGQLQQYESLVKAFSILSPQIEELLAHCREKQEEVKGEHGFLCRLFHQHLGVVSPLEEMRQIIAKKWHTLLETLMEVRFSFLWMRAYLSISDSRFNILTQELRECHQVSIPLSTDYEVCSFHKFVQNMSKRVTTQIEQAPHLTAEEKSRAIPTFKSLWKSFCCVEASRIETWVKQAVYDYNQKLDQLKQGVLSDEEICTLNVVGSQVVVGAIVEEQKNRAKTIAEEEVQRSALLNNWFLVASLLGEVHLQMGQLIALSAPNTWYLVSLLKGTGEEALSPSASTEWIKAEKLKPGTLPLQTRGAVLASPENRRIDRSHSLILQPGRGRREVIVPALALSLCQDVDTLKHNAKDLFSQVKANMMVWKATISLDQGPSFAKAYAQYNQLLESSMQVAWQIPSCLQEIKAEYERLLSLEADGPHCASQKARYQEIKTTLDEKVAFLRKEWTALTYELDELRTMIDWACAHIARHSDPLNYDRYSAPIPYVTKDYIEPVAWLLGQMRLAIYYSNQIGTLAKSSCELSLQEASVEFRFCRYLWGKMIKGDILSAIEGSLKQYVGECDVEIKRLSEVAITREVAVKLEQSGSSEIVEVLMHDHQQLESKVTALKQGRERSLKHWANTIEALTASVELLNKLHERTQERIGGLSFLSSSLGSLISMSPQPAITLEVDQEWLAEALAVVY